MPRPVFVVEEDRQHRARDRNYQRSTVSLLLDGRRVPVLELSAHLGGERGRITVETYQHSWVNASQSVHVDDVRATVQVSVPRDAYAPDVHVAKHRGRWNLFDSGGGIVRDKDHNQDLTGYETKKAALEAVKEMQDARRPR